jgi:hypothetical protein
MHVLTAPVYLSSITVGELFNEEALRRALFGRLEGGLTGMPIPNIHTRAIAYFKCDSRVVGNYHCQNYLFSLSL